MAKRRASWRKAKASNEKSGVSSLKSAREAGSSLRNTMLQIIGIQICARSGLLTGTLTRTGPPLVIRQVLAEGGRNSVWAYGVDMLCERP